MSETCARKPEQMSPRNRRMIRKVLQNPSKMVPWRPLGGLWGARGLRSCFPELSWGALGGSWAARVEYMSLFVDLKGSWRLLGGCWAAQGQRIIF